MKELDKFIEDNGFREGQSVKVGYDNLKEFINQRVIEELERQMELAQIGNSYTRLRDRVKELKTK